MMMMMSGVARWTRRPVAPRATIITATAEDEDDDDGPAEQHPRIMVSSRSPLSKVVRCFDGTKVVSLPSLEELPPIP